MILQVGMYLSMKISSISGYFVSLFWLWAYQFFSISFSLFFAFIFSSFSFTLNYQRNFKFQVGILHEICTYYNTLVVLCKINHWNFTIGIKNTNSTNINWDWKEIDEISWNIDMKNRKQKCLGIFLFDHQSYFFNQIFVCFIQN